MTTVSATDTELQLPVNAIFQQTFLRQAQPLAPYYIGSKQGELIRHGGSATAKWRRIGAITPTVTALTELTGAASYMQGRTSSTASFTDITATIAKYGQYIILNEEVDVFSFNGQTDEVMMSLGISAGRSLNQLQRNVMEDNATLVYAGNVASDGVVASKVTLASIDNVINTLLKQSAMLFTPLSVGSELIGTTPILPAFWGLCHIDVAYDVKGLSGFISVEDYASHTAIAPGEFGLVPSSGAAVRFIQSPDASKDNDSGAAVGSTGLRSNSANVDLYTTVIFGREAVGSLGLGRQHTDGVYRAGEKLGSVELIAKKLGSGGTSDPYNEIMTIAWKSWHAGAILNTNWIRGIRSGATDITA